MTFLDEQIMILVRMTIEVVSGLSFLHSEKLGGRSSSKNGLFTTILSFLWKIYAGGVYAVFRLQLSMHKQASWGNEEWSFSFQSFSLLEGLHQWSFFAALDDNQHLPVNFKFITIFRWTDNLMPDAIFRPEESQAAKKMRLLKTL